MFAGRNFTMDPDRPLFVSAPCDVLRSCSASSFMMALKSCSTASDCPVAVSGSSKQCFTLLKTSILNMDLWAERCHGSFACFTSFRLSRGLKTWENMRENGGNFLRKPWKPMTQQSWTTLKQPNYANVNSAVLFLTRPPVHRTSQLWTEASPACDDKRVAHVAFQHFTGPQQSSRLSLSHSTTFYDILSVSSSYFVFLIVSSFGPQEMSSLSKNALTWNKKRWKVSCLHECNV